MGNCILGSIGRWTNKCTFSGGSWNSSYPVSNLNVLPLSKVARSVDLNTANTQFIATLDEQRPVQLIGIANHNLSLDALIRVTLYSDAGLTNLIYDTGWQYVWPSVYTPDQLIWENDNFFSCTYTQDQILDYKPPRVFWLNQVYVPIAIKVEISDATNTSGYTEIGLFEVAQGWQTSVNISYNSQYGFRFRTDSEEALGGVKYFDREDKPTVFQGTINYLPQAEAKAQAFEHFRQMDLDTPFIWILNPDDQINLLRDSFLARNLDPGLITYAAYNANTVPFKFEQVL